MLQSLEETKLMAKSQLSEKELKDPEEMFDQGIMTMEILIMTALAQYVKCHSGEYYEYQEMLDYLVEEGVIDDESKLGYFSVLALTDFWR